MHQGHNIPWSIISSNFYFKENDTRYTPPRTGLTPKENPNRQKELKHFINKFVQTIRNFSDTERQKYPATFDSPSEGNLFSDELRDKYPAYLNSRNQKIENWIAPTRGFRSSGGNLADVIKILLDENEMSTLLMLAHHPSIRVANLHNLHWEYHFGFSRVKESAVRSYMFFNSAEATGILENGIYANKGPEGHYPFGQYPSLISELSWKMNFPAQQIPHIRFLEDCGIAGPENLMGYVTDAEKSLYDQNYPRLQEYLKELFALMYRYDVFVRECGLDPNWEEEIANQYPFWRCVSLKWDASQEKVFLA